MVEPTTNRTQLETLVGTPHEVLQRAIQRYNAGEYIAALTICQELIAVDKHNAEALYILANVAIQTGEGDEAVGLFVRAVNIAPTNAKFSRGFADALERTGRTAQAIHAWSQTLAMAPDVADAPPRLARLLAREERFSEAIDVFRRALELTPNDPEIHHDLAVALHRTGQLAAAVETFEAALRLQTNGAIRAECHNGLAATLRQCGRYAEAVVHGRQAVEFAPDSSSARNNLGLALFDSGDDQAAVSMLEEARRLKPNDPDILNNLGVALTRAHRSRDAKILFDRVLKQRPGWAEGHLNLANLLRQDGRPDAAVEHYQAALAAQPNDFRIHGSLALAQMNLDQPYDAITTYEKALTLSPENPELLQGLGIAQLLTGNFDDGWRHYESRRCNPDYATRVFTGVPWNGEALNGGTLLVYAEQGFGDTLQFCRYLPMVLARAKPDSLVFECQRPLCGLMRSLAGAYEIIARGDPLPETGHHISLLSLPGLFGTTEATIPSTSPYLSPPHIQPVALDMPQTAMRPKIGLVWAGNPLRQDDAMRSCPVAMLEPLLAKAGPQIHTLQQAADGQSREWLQRYGAIDLAPDIKDFNDTAAAISSLDLIISVDTATAHLAGALGKAVWVLLGHAADWRYLRNRTDSPWYPSMRLFRQSRRGDWHGLIRHVIDTLGEEFGR